MYVSDFVSPVAAIPEVRKKLVAEQQLMGLNGGIVMDGRDIGSVVFPNADLKLFMTASAEIRAKRRYNELIERKLNVDYNEVYKNVTERDYIDSNRKDSPLRMADDAIEIDNSNLSVKEQITEIMNLVERTLNIEK